MLFLLASAPVSGQVVLSEEVETNVETVLPCHSSGSKSFDKPLFEAAEATPLYGSFIVKLINEYIACGIAVQGEGVTT